jgi:hypothetical protein
MMVSAIINPELAAVFERGDLVATSQRLEKPKKLNFRVSDRGLAENLEAAIITATERASEVFAGVLAEGRSLRKDDVRSRRSQEALLEKVTTGKEAAGREGRS